MQDDVKRVDMSGNVPEELPSLADFAEEPGGAWPKGWYAATIVEGYATGKGKVFHTEDAPSRDGTSRNLFLCLAVQDGKGQVRNIRETVNYRISDFDRERLETIAELRAQFKGVRGAWPGYADLQRTSLAIARLGQLEKALGFRLQRTPVGVNPAPFVGQAVAVRLGVDENGYNEITAFAAAGSRK